MIQLSDDVKQSQLMAIDFNGWGHSIVNYRSREMFRNTFSFCLCTYINRLWIVALNAQLLITRQPTLIVTVKDKLLPPVTDYMIAID